MITFLSLWRNNERSHGISKDLGSFSVQLSSLHNRTCVGECLQLSSLWFRLFKWEVGLSLITNLDYQCDTNSVEIYGYNSYTRYRLIYTSVVFNSGDLLLSVFIRRRGLTILHVLTSCKQEGQLLPLLVWNISIVRGI